MAGVPLFRPDESGDDCGGVDADESVSEGEGMDRCERVHRTVEDAGDGHQNQSVEALEPENMDS